MEILDKTSEGLAHGNAFKADPTCLVLHYTAGPTYSSALGGLKSAGTSAHFIVDLDGTVFQMLPLTVAGYHAGKSVWRGQEFVNSFSLGIEIVNWGLLTVGSQGVDAKTWTKTPVHDGFVYKHTDDTYWHVYPQAQRTAVAALCLHLFGTIASLKGIVGHSIVSPGRKVDPGPALLFSGTDCDALIAATSARGGLIHVDTRQQILS